MLLFSEWGKKYYILPPGSAVPGLINMNLTLHIVEILNELSPFTETEEIIFPKGTQIAGTTISDIASQCIVDIYRVPFLMLFGNRDMARNHVITRVEKAFSRNPRLKGKVKSSFDKKSGTNRHLKIFPGGYGRYDGGRSGTVYRHDSYVYVFIDDGDAFIRDVGGTKETIGEGSPVELAKSRMDAQQGKGKFYLSGTPTDEESSLVWNEFLKTDQRKFFAPCPECGAEQILDFFRIKFTRNENYELNSEPYLECEICKAHIPEYKKQWMLARAVWKPTVKTLNPRIKGYWLPSTYSLLGLTWAKMAQEWWDAIKAKKKGDLTKLVRFYNHRLALPFKQEAGDKVEHSELFNRREHYEMDSLPRAITVVDAGIDVQVNRIEITVYGDSEYNTWGIQHKILGGDPTIKYGIQGSVWNDLEVFLNTKYRNEDGVALPIMCSCLDTGNWTEQAMHFLNHSKIKRRKYKVYGIKGSSTPNAPLVKGPNKDGIFLVGTDVAKDSLFFRLQVPPEEDGGIHFNQGFSEQFFKQLTVERMVYVYNKEGQRQRKWVKKDHERNETTDCFNYSRAAVHILNPDWDAVMKNRKKRLNKKNTKKKKSGPRKSFATSW